MLQTTNTLIGQRASILSTMLMSYGKLLKVFMEAPPTSKLSIRRSISYLRTVDCRVSRIESVFITLHKKCVKGYVDFALHIVPKPLGIPRNLADIRLHVVLPVCWRHLLDFPKKRQSRKEQDLGSTQNYDEEYPSLEDITIEGGMWSHCYATLGNKLPPVLPSEEKLT